MGKKILIVSHENSLKALIKYLDILSDEETADLHIPNGVPLVYELDRRLNPIKHYYLGDQKDIKSKINEIKNQNS